jgi:hypothetical protein
VRRCRFGRIYPGAISPVVIGSWSWAGYLQTGLLQAAACSCAGHLIQAGYSKRESPRITHGDSLKVLALLMTIGLQAFPVFVLADLLPSFLDDTPHTSPRASYLADSEALFILIFFDRNQAIP